LPVGPGNDGRMRWSLAFAGFVVACEIAAAEPAAAPAASATESVHEALCRLIEAASRDHDVPAEFLTNLIWRESSFRRDAVSRAGAQGIAQFMPYTAAQRGLLDPFDPEQAIPHAARLIAELRQRFGNLGLAAAAYNAGAGRIDKWLAKEATLPAETRQFVVAVTGRSAEDWSAAAAAGETPPSRPAECAKIVASLRHLRLSPQGPAAPSVSDAPFAPWGVQLSGNFSKDRALASFARVRQQYAGVIGEAQPMVIGTRLRSRGSQAFYRVRLPAQSRAAADALCGRIRSVGGACIVLRS